jgi:hypothetical protein
LPLSQPLAAYPTTPRGLAPASAAPVTGAAGKQTRASAATPPTVTPRGPAAPAHTPGPPGKARISRRGLLIGGAAVAGAAALGGAGFLFFSKSAPAQPTHTTPTGTIPITLTYSTEKEAWMQASIAAFHRSNTLLGGKAIQVTLDPRGSIDAQQRILN